MKYILPKPDIRYFDEGLNSQIESHSHAQLRIEVTKARADEREACINAVWQYPGIGLNDRLTAIISIKARGSK